MTAWLLRAGLFKEVTLITKRRSGSAGQAEQRPGQGTQPGRGPKDKMRCIWRLTRRRGGWSRGLGGCRRA